MSLFKVVFQEDRGEDLLEYGLLLAFMAVVALTVIISDPLSLGVTLEGAYQSCINVLRTLTG